MADEKKRIDEPTGTETVGHEWDGIEELDTPMPRWWLWTLYATIIWAIGYTVVYPAWPGITGFTEGTADWSSRGELAEEMAAETARKAPMTAALAQIPLERLPEDSRLLQFAVEGGRSAFKVNCVQCHGSGAAGSKGYPNLNDDDWLWGGDLQSIHETLEVGIREPGNDDTRYSEMPAFGKMGILDRTQIADVVSHVRFISGAEGSSESSLRGAGLYADNCAACHGATGKGDRSMGAPDLTDAIWLYGGDRASLTETVTNSRYGIMPSWGSRLDPVTVKMLAAYVHSLGGGEAFVPEVSDAEVQSTGSDAPDPVTQNEQPAG
ncbi:cytochrome-c oxidase, cbb3-type subunit III [Sphingomicrobium aestuariivivum]|uniref:cytochrome-c oxidase, cbb3-type subunit III n=1 Tax=Sphingomicrobium aestuariivivum TaxID=1582356 RepID=UPI001FD6C5B0|nr:cytochrome-c oxidase, cbb3-type subunit III [Sphingomicrobium aestuariivivum]MCJ8191289.1 cytochrome-c oxidase, cbb3-type subunit III [Sphingomicrobium aestuariivivum]